MFLVHLAVFMGGKELKYYTPYSARMSPENAHKLMAFYMDVLVLGVIL